MANHSTNRANRSVLYRVIWALLVLSVIPSFIGLGNTLPDVQHPNPTAFSVFELTLLVPQVVGFQDAMAHRSLAAQRVHAGDEWSALEFALYSSGVLQELGYETVIVTDGSPEENAHVWLLVGLPLYDRTAWIPVEPTPAEGGAQTILGTIPWAVGDGGYMWFEEEYVTFQDLIQRPQNEPPSVRVRSDKPPLKTEEYVSFRAIAASDPDGEIVLYHWNFGDGSVEVSQRKSISHRYDRAGPYTVVLTVIDNHGAFGSSAIDIGIINPKDCPTCGPQD